MKTKNLFIVLVIFILLLSSCGEREDRASSTLVYKTASNHVKNNLSNPRSAEFPLDKISDHAYKIEGEENLFFIDSYVTVQNAFGGSSRIYFQVKVEYLGDSEYQSYDLKFID